jgi:peptide deformylase
MAEIVKYGAGSLRKKAVPVTETGEAALLIPEMLRAMHEHNGIGLAAPQIGVNLRIIVIDLGEGPLALVNPEIVEMSSEKETLEEGCLSVPQVYVEVERAQTVRVKGISLNGKPVELEARGFFARVLQHEIDHLDGILIVDRISFTKRQLLKRKLTEIAQTRREL